MATIQKIKNKSGISYRVLVRKTGHKTITKTFQNKNLALKFAAELELNSAYRERHDVGDITFHKLAQHYLASGSLGSRPKQQTMMTRYWAERLGHLKVIDITPSVITQHLEELKDRYAFATINRYKAVISVIFNHARRSLAAIDNPVSLVPTLKEDNARTRFLSHDERRRLLKACKDAKWGRFHLLVLMAITTGARRSELSHLTWSQIDLERGLAYISTTKNGEPRTLPLTDSVITELAKLDQQQALIFHSTRHPNKPYDFTKQWLKALDEAGITNFRFHDLRHTCASYLAQGGASLLEIAEVLGHKQIQMTKRYAHLCVSHKQKLINDHFGQIR